VLAIAGGVTVATGVVLWVTAPKRHRLEVSASVGPVTGLVLDGRF